MVSGSLRVLRLPPPLKLVTNDIAEILLKVALNTINQIKSNPFGIALLIWIDYFSSNIDNVYNINEIVKMNLQMSI